jgi:hypothetical protein
VGNFFLLVGVKQLEVRPSLAVVVTAAAAAAAAAEARVAPQKNSREKRFKQRRLCRPLRHWALSPTTQAVIQA